MISSRYLRRIRHYSVRALGVDVVLALFIAGPAGDVVHLLGLVLLLAAGGAVAMLWWRLGARRWWVFGGDRRTAQLQAIYRDAAQRAQEPGIELVRVVRVTHKARLGTKAIVRHRDGGTQDAWVWGLPHVRRGGALLVRARTGYGPHTYRDHVLYIGTRNAGGGIIGSIPPAAWRAGQRQPR